MWKTKKEEYKAYKMKEKPVFDERTYWYYQ